MRRSVPNLWRALATDVLAAGLGVGAVLAVLDLWHVALRHPATLSLRDVVGLTALYVLGTTAVAIAVLVPLRLCRVRSARSAAVVRALMLAAGGWLFALELALQMLPVRSPLRPWAAPVLLLAAVTSVGLLASFMRDVERRLPLAGVLALLAVIGALGALGATAPPPRAGHPTTAPAAVTDTNVLLVTIDTLRADHLSVYGYALPTSPRIDALAAGSVLFEHAVSQAATPTPATASLLTGRFPSRHGGGRDRSTVDDNAVLLAEILRAAGFETAAFSANPWITPEFGFGQGFDHFFAVPRERIVRFPLLLMAFRRVNRLFDPHALLYGRVRRWVVGDVPTWERDEQVTDETLAWIEANRARPFFAYVHYMSPQQPYDAPPPLGERFVPDVSVEPMRAQPHYSLWFSKDAEPLPPAAQADLLARYDGSILFVDRQVGRLVRRLGRLGLLDRTVVVLTSDQGEEFYEHRNWGHGRSLYDEVLHVPLLMRYPPALPAGQRVAKPTMLVDVMPTILELAGVAAPAAIEGRSLLPLARTSEDDGWPDGYAEHLGSIAEAHAVVKGRWKLIVVREGGRTWSELYDLEADRGETHDLVAAGEEPPGVVDELWRLLRETRESG